VHETRLCEIYIEAIYSIYDFEIHVFQKKLALKNAHLAEPEYLKAF